LLFVKTKIKTFCRSSRSLETKTYDIRVTNLSAFAHRTPNIGNLVLNLALDYV